MAESHSLGRGSRRTRVFYLVWMKAVTETFTYMQLLVRLDRAAGAALGAAVRRFVGCASLLGATVGMQTRAREDLLAELAEAYAAGVGDLRDQTRSGQAGDRVDLKDRFV